MLSDGERDARNSDFNRKLDNWLAYLYQERVRRAREREAMELRFGFLKDADQNLKIILRRHHRPPSEPLVTARDAAELREWYKLAAP